MFLVSGSSSSQSGASPRTPSALKPYIFSEFDQGKSSEILSAAIKLKNSLSAPASFSVDPSSSAFKCSA